MIARHPPPDVYLDTSVVIGAMYTGTPNVTACRGFCQHLAAAGSQVYFSQVLRLELARALRRLATKAEKLSQDEQIQYRLDQWGTNSLVRQRWLASGVRRFHAFLDQFQEADEIPLTTSAWRQSLDVMAVEGLDATDAMHLVVARSLGVGALATADRDFRRVSHPRIHLIRDRELP